MPPTDEHDYTHKDIWVAITELTGRIDNGLAIMAERKEGVAKITKDVDALFSRQRQLETRLAQIAGIGLVLTFGIPVLATILQLKLVIPAAIEQQEKGK
jgi:hypothetical protein